MLKIRVIPALTVKDAKLVKSVQFQNHRNIGNYVAAVRVFNARDVDELIFLDLDAHEKGIETWLLEEVTKECFMPVTIGGGVKTIDEVQTLLSLGADKVSVNSEAIRRPAFITEIAERYGSQCAVVSIDVKKIEKGWEVFYDGGTHAAGLDVIEWAKEVEKHGAGEILLHSIDRDGVMEGYDLDLIRNVAGAVRIPVVALGGAGKVSDCVEAVRAGASAIAAASIFQYTETTPQIIKQALSEAGFPARVR